MWLFTQMETAKGLPYSATEQPVTLQQVSGIKFHRYMLTF